MAPTLMTLLFRNRAQAHRQLEIHASQDGNEATIYLYDMIVGDEMTAAFYGGGISPQAFIQRLENLTAKTLHLRINSPGGDVFGARCMEQALRQCNAQIIAHIDGLCASAATYLALAADEVEMAPGAFFMIHQSACGAYGNADELMDTAALLEKIDDSIVATYQQKTGQDIDQIQSWMAAETWFNAEEAVRFGFGDRISGSDEPPVESSWDLSAFRNAPLPVVLPCRSDTPAETTSEPIPVLRPSLQDWACEHQKRLLRLKEKMT